MNDACNDWHPYAAMLCAADCHAVLCCAGYSAGAVSTVSIT